MWALFLLIFNFNTMTWTYADIDGALIFPNQEACLMPMARYNEILMDEKYVFVCEPYVPGLSEQKRGRNWTIEELQRMLDDYKKEELKQETPSDLDEGLNLFKNLGTKEPNGLDV